MPRRVRIGAGIHPGAHFVQARRVIPRPAIKANKTLAAREDIRIFSSE